MWEEDHSFEASEFRCLLPVSIAFTSTLKEEFSSNSDVSVFLSALRFGRTHHRL